MQPSVQGQSCVHCSVSDITCTYKVWDFKAYKQGVVPVM